MSTKDLYASLAATRRGETRRAVRLDPFELTEPCDLEAFRMGAVRQRNTMSAELALSGPADYMDFDIDISHDRFISPSEDINLKLAARSQNTQDGDKTSAPAASPAASPAVPLGPGPDTRQAQQERAAKHLSHVQDLQQLMRSKDPKDKETRGEGTSKLTRGLFAFEGLITGLEVKDLPCLGPDPSTWPSLHDIILSSDELIITFTIHKATMTGYEHYDDRLLVLGSQTLLDLRRAFTGCPTTAAAQSLGRETTGAFFFIDGVFYTDDRPESADIAEPIIAFLHDHGIRPGPPPILGGHTSGLVRQSDQDDDLRWEESRRLSRVFEKKRMDTVQIKDLALRAGRAAGYIFCHHGLCEHLVEVEDIRLVHEDDAQVRALYPFTYAHPKDLGTHVRVNSRGFVRLAVGIQHN